MRNDPSNETQEKIREAEEKRLQAKGVLERAGFLACGALDSLDERPARKGGKLCLGMECLDRGLWELEPVVAELARVGVFSARLQSGWARTETRKGAYDFSALDTEVRLLRESGITPWLSLSYGNPLYYPGDPSELRAGGIGHVPIETREEREAWTRYVAAAVSRYRGQICRYEIWNEPDVRVFFPPRYGDWAEKYMELIRLTAPVIRANDPEAKIVACTGSMTGLLPLLEAGLGELVDEYSFHNYSAFPETQNLALRESLRALRDQWAPSMRIVRGEAGCPSYNAPTSFGALHDMKTSETIQAKWAGRHLIADFADPAIAETSYFHAYEFLHFSRMHRYYYGILRQDGTRKPVYGVLQLLAHLFDGETLAAPWRTLQFEGMQAITARVCSFERRGAPLIAFWQSEPIGDECRAVRVKARAFPRTGWAHLVALDTLTRCVYPVSADEQGAMELPLCDHAMVLTEAEALREFLDGETARALTELTRASLAKVGQYSEE